MRAGARKDRRLRTTGSPGWALGAPPFGAPAAGGRGGQQGLSPRALGTGDRHSPSSSLVPSGAGPSLENQAPSPVSPIGRGRCRRWTEARARWAWEGRRGSDWPISPGDGGATGHVPTTLSDSAFDGRRCGRRRAVYRRPRAVQGGQRQDLGARPLPPPAPGPCSWTACRQGAPADTEAASERRRDGGGRLGEG